MAKRLKGWDNTFHVLICISHWDLKPHMKIQPISFSTISIICVRIIDKLQQVTLSGIRMKISKVIDNCVGG